LIQKRTGKIMNGRKPCFTGKLSAIL